jgi:hypothetical protein
VLRIALALAISGGLMTYGPSLTEVYRQIGFAAAHSISPNRGVGITGNAAEFAAIASAR